MKNYKNPKISVIIPCLNAGNTIQRTIDSLRAQEYCNLECIVVDGSSSDNTKEIINQNLDIITTYISEKDTNAAEAQNKGIKLATGDLIGYLHSDDYFSKNMLREISSAYIHNNNFDIFSYGIKIKNLSNNKVIMSSCSKKNLNLNLNNILFKHSMGHFFKKDLFDKYGLLKIVDSSGGTLYANDREHLIRLCLLGKKNYVVENILYIMGSHDGSNTLSRKNFISIRNNHIEIADSFLRIYKECPYKKKKLNDFKAHNIVLLFYFYIAKFLLYKAFTTFKLGLNFRKITWFYDIFASPTKEILYRISVMKW